MNPLPPAKSESPAQPVGGVDTIEHLRRIDQMWSGDGLTIPIVLNSQRLCGSLNRGHLRWTSEKC